MKIDLKNINIKDLASLICDILRKDNIEAVLTGGACVSIYSSNKYVSSDLDFVTYSTIKEIVPILKKIGFLKKSGRHFEHPKCPYFIEFLNPPVAIGDVPIKEFNNIKTKYGVLKLLTVEDCIKDRLAGYYFWDDPQSLDQAVLLAKSHKNRINYNSMKKWSKREGQLKKYNNFLKIIDNVN